MNFYPALLALFFVFTQVLFAKAGGDLPDVCRRAIVEDRCHDKSTRWYYDQRDKDCRKFWGCSGFGNNFHSKDACEDRCEDEHNGCRRKNCDDCEKCIEGRCVPAFHNIFCHRRVFEGVQPVEPLIVPPIRTALPANDLPVVSSDPCDNIICGKCQRCDNGQCFSEPACSINACIGITCGECQRCEDGICIHNQGCVVAPPADAPPADAPVEADTCTGVVCPECYACSRGQCVRVAGCRVFNFGRCQGFGPCRACGPCRTCVDGWCIPRRDGICEQRVGRPGVFGRFSRGRFEEREGRHREIERLERLEDRIEDRLEDHRDRRFGHRFERRFD